MMQKGSDASPEASYFTPSSCSQRLGKKEEVELQFFVQTLFSSLCLSLCVSITYDP